MREAAEKTFPNGGRNQSYPARKNGADKRIAHLRKLLLADLARQWTADAMAREINVSVSHLGRLFRAETGLAPLQFLREARLALAADLLRNSFLSVKEIRCRAGLWDKSAFIRDFKKKFGVTPTEYRNQTSENPPAEFDNLAEGKSA
jgi:AraC-like DNA-binding protein